jgi:hypothetical protein
MPITELAALGGLLTGIIGMVLSLLNYIRSRTNTESFIIDAQAARQANASSDFLKEYYGPEFMIVRSEAWNVGFDFCRGNDHAYHQVALYLIGDPEFDPRSTNVPPANLAANNQTPLQNLSRLVNFWHRVGVYSQLGLVNRDILTPLRHEYETWSPFFNRITELSNAHLQKSGTPKSKAPEWLAKLQEMGKFVW